MLAQLKTLGLAVEEVQGSKRRVTTHDGPALERWIAATYSPPVESPLPGRRAGNIARARRSKAGVSTHDVQPLLLRWFEPDASAPLAELTQRMGLVGLTTDRVASLRPPAPWNLLTVENWESFVATSYEHCTATVVVTYTGGNIADATVRALASIQPPPERALHFGDYDWAGLTIYRRMRATIGRLQLYVPDDLAALFARFADPEVIMGQVPLTAREDDALEVRQVIALIARHNGGLEQEIVMLPHAPER